MAAAGAAPERPKLEKRPAPRADEAGPSHAVHSSGPRGRERGLQGKKPPSVREMLRRCLELVGVADIGPNKATFNGLSRIGDLLPETDPQPPRGGEKAQPAPTVKVGEGHIGYVDLERLLSAWGAEGQEDNPNSRKFALFRRIVARGMVVRRNIISFIEMGSSESRLKRASYKPDILPNWVGKAIPGSKYDRRRPKAKHRFISPLDVVLGNPCSFFRISVPRDGNEFLVRAYVYGCFGNFAYSLKLLEVETFCDPDGKAILAAVPWAWGPERRRPSYTIAAWGCPKITEVVKVKLRTPTGERLRPLADGERFNLGIGDEMKLLYHKVCNEEASSSKAPLP